MEKELLEELEETVTSGRVAFFIINSGEEKPVLGVGRIGLRGEITVIVNKVLDNISISEITGIFPARFGIRRRIGNVNEIPWEEYKRILFLDKSRAMENNVEIERERDLLNVLEAPCVIERTSEHISIASGSLEPDREPIFGQDLRPAQKIKKRRT